MPKSSFSLTRSRALEPLEILHMDIKPMPYKASTGESVLLVIIDDFTRYKTIIGLDSRKDQKNIIEPLLSYLERQSGHNIKKIRKDGAQENYGKLFTSLLKEKGIIDDTIPHKSPQLNGVAERYNRTLFDKIKTMMQWALAPDELWLEAAHYANLLCNWSPSRAIRQGETPYSMFFKRTPKWEILRVWGCRCVYKTPVTKNKPLDSSGAIGIFIGWDIYYKIFDPVLNRVFSVHDVKFYEDQQGWLSTLSSQYVIPRQRIRQQERLRSTRMISFWNFYTPLERLIRKIESKLGIVIRHEYHDFGFRCLSSGWYTLHNALLKNWNYNTGISLLFPTEDNVETLVTKIKGDHSSSVVIVPALPNATWFGELKDLSCNDPFLVSLNDNSLFANKSSDNSSVMCDTKAFDDLVAIFYIDGNPNKNIHPYFYLNQSTKESENLWHNARLEELDSLKKKEVYELVPRPPNEQILRTHWIDTTKKDENGDVIRYKSRLVVNGNKQKQYLDALEKYAPVARIPSIRILISYAIHMRKYIIQLDFKTAFLNSKLRKIIYCFQPPGYKDKISPEYVMKLFKALYGLPESPKRWYETWNEVATKLGFVRCESDRCVYVSKNGEMVLGIYVDDILLIANSKEEAEEMVAKLQKEFELSYNGEPGKYLGFQLKPKAKGFHVTQDAYIQHILQQFGNKYDRNRDIPMYNYDLVNKESTPLNNTTTPYRQVVGSLLYLSGGTRPDIAFATNFWARFQSNYTSHHWNGVNKVLQYLSGTKQVGLFYEFSSGKSEMLLEGYSDCKGTCKMSSGD